MDYRHLGRTGVQVSPLCLGTMNFGAWGNSDHDDSIRVIHRALDAGINFVDTADVYSFGESEEIVGKALAGGRRDNVVLATKVFNGMGEDPNVRGLSRRWILTEVENSLRRLGTDWIDLYQVHRADPHTDIEETLEALDDLVRSGKVRYIGCSTFPAHELVEAQWVSRTRRTARFVTEQPPYSIFARSIEADVLPVAQQYDMGVLPWSPLAGGWLTGRFRKGQDLPQGARQKAQASLFDVTTDVGQRRLDAAEALAQLAEQAGLSMIDLALGFTLAHPAVTSPIIGPRTMEQLESQLGAGDVVLSSDVLDRIDEIVPPGSSLFPEEVPPAIKDPALRRR